MRSAPTDHETRLYTHSLIAYPIDALTPPSAAIIDNRPANFLHGNKSYTRTDYQSVQCTSECAISGRRVWGHRYCASVSKRRRVQQANEAVPSLLWCPRCMRTSPGDVTPFCVSVQVDRAHSNHEAIQASTSMKCAGQQRRTAGVWPPLCAT